MTANLRPAGKRAHAPALACALAALLVTDPVSAVEAQRLMSPKEQSERRAPPLKRLRHALPNETGAADAESAPTREELARLRLENQQLKLENRQLLEEVRQRLKENVELRERLTENAALVEELKNLRAQHEELREDIRKVLATETKRTNPDAPLARPAGPARETATRPKPAASAPGPPASPPTAGGSHWLTTSTGKRHNDQCPFFRTSAGRHCGPTEGKACRNCGG